MDISELLQSKREEIVDLANQHGAYNIRIFGSVARGEANENSDIDFLLDLGRDLSPWFPVRLIRDIRAIIKSKSRRSN